MSQNVVIMGIAGVPANTQNCTQRLLMILTAYQDDCDFLVRSDKIPIDLSMQAHQRLPRGDQVFAVLCQVQGKFPTHPPPPLSHCPLYNCHVIKITACGLCLNSDTKDELTGQYFCKSCHYDVATFFPCASFTLSFSSSRQLQLRLRQLQRARATQPSSSTPSSQMIPLCPFQLDQVGQDAYDLTQAALAALDAGSYDTALYAGMIFVCYLRPLVLGISDSMPRWTSVHLAELPASSHLYLCLCCQLSSNVKSHTCGIQILFGRDLKEEALRSYSPHPCKCNAQPLKVYRKGSKYAKLDSFNTRSFALCR